MVGVRESKVRNGKAGYERSQGFGANLEPAIVPADILYAVIVMFSPIDLANVNGSKVGHSCAESPFDLIARIFNINTNCLKPSFRQLL